MYKHVGIVALVLLLLSMPMAFAVDATTPVTTTTTASTDVKADAVTTSAPAPTIWDDVKPGFRCSIALGQAKSVCNKGCLKLRTAAKESVDAKGKLVNKNTAGSLSAVSKCNAECAVEARAHQKICVKKPVVAAKTAVKADAKATATTNTVMKK